MTWFMIAAIGILILMRFFVTIVYNNFFHSLAKFNGPVHRAFTSIPYIWELWKGDQVQNVHELHRKYGSIVRIAPDILSFTSAQAWKDIYGFRQNKKQIAKDYKRFPDVSDALPILCSNDADHARMRKLTAHAFTDTALKEQLPLIASHLQTFISRLDDLCCTGLPIDLNKWINAFSFDVITDLSFGEPLDALNKDGKDAYIDEFFTACKMWPIIPTIWEYRVARWAFGLLMMVPCVRKKQEQGWLNTKDKVRRRIEADATTTRKDFMTYMLKERGEKGMTEPELVGSTSVFVNAGGESTSACIAGAIFYLMLSPIMMERAYQEVVGAFKSLEEITKELCELPYLNAVIEETLRIYPPTPGLFSRRTGIEPELIDGVIVPPNTSIGVHVFAAHRSATNFKDPDQFVPDRWMPEGQKQYCSDQKASMQPWSVGPRNCMGKRLAYMEIRTALASLLLSYHFELCTENKDWITAQSYNIVWIRSPLHVRLRRREGLKG